VANEVFDGNIQTLQISTGNVQTVNDPFITGSLGQGQFGSPSGARNPLGMAAYISDGTTSGRRWKVRYVRMNATVPNSPFIVGPVYWKDNTFQVVTSLLSEALHGVNAIAGLLMNANVTNGNFCFILVYGHVGAANIGAVTVPASTAAGDALIGAAGQQTFARVAANTAPTNAVLAWAETAISGGVADIFTCLEQ
jgi:hypothetical protein